MNFTRSSPMSSAEPPKPRSRQDEEALRNTARLLASVGLTLARAATTEHPRFVSGRVVPSFGCGHDFQPHSGACEVSKTAVCNWEQFLFAPARILDLDQQNLKGQFHVIADYSRSAFARWRRWLLRIFQMGKRRRHRCRRARLDSCGAHVCVRRGVAAPMNGCECKPDGAQRSAS